MKLKAVLIIILAGALALFFISSRSSSGLGSLVTNRQNVASVLSGTSSITGIVELSVKPSKKAYALGEDIPFTALLANKTSQSMTFKFDGCVTSYRIGTYDSTSVPCKTGASEFTLKPGQTTSFSYTHKKSTHSLSSGLKTITLTLTGYGSATAQVTVNSTEAVAAPTPTVIPVSISATATDASGNMVATENSPVKPITGTPPTVGTSSATGTRVVIPPKTGAATTGQKKLPATTNLSLTVNKINDKISASLMVTNNATVAVTYTFNTGAQAYLDAQSLYTTKNNPTTMALTQFTLQPKATKNFVFTPFKATTPGSYTITSGLVGYDRYVMKNITIGMTGTTSTSTATSVPPTPPTPPTPPITEPPVVVPPAANGEIILKGSDKASYKALETSLAGFIEQSTNSTDRANFTEFLSAIKEINANTTNAGWSGDDYSKRPNNLYLVIEDAPSAIFADSTNKSFLAAAKNAIAAVFVAIRNIFTENSSGTTSGGKRITSFAVGNNVCQRYFFMVDESGNDLAITNNESDAVPILNILAVYLPDAKKIDTFQYGVCGYLSTFDSLRAFDVAAAVDDAEFKSYHSASPYDNSKFYEFVNVDGKKYVRKKLLNRMVEYAAIKAGTGLGGDQGLYGMTIKDHATIHTTFNNYGPADFECTTYNLVNPGEYLIAKNQINSCKTAGLLSYQVGTMGGHVEKINSITSTKTSYTIETTDAFSQGTQVKVGKRYVADFKDVPLDRGANKYTFSINTGDALPKLTAFSSYKPKISNYVSPQVSKTVPWMKMVSCRDKSDIIRELPNAKWAPIQFNLYNKIADHWVTTNEKDLRAVYAQQGIEEFLPYGWTPPSPGHPISWYNHALGPNPDYILPDFSKCVNDVKIDAEVKVYEDAMKEWVRKWNKKAYENKGYVPKDSLASLEAEKQKIMDALNDKIYKYHSCVDREKVTSGDPTWEAIQKKWWDTVWIPAAKEAGLKIDEIKSNPICCSKGNPTCELLK